jgi:hypothetical protein
MPDAAERKEDDVKDEESPRGRSNLKRGGGRSHFMTAVKAPSSNISSARDSPPSQPQSFAINARTAQISHFLCTSSLHRITIPPRRQRRKTVVEARAGSEDGLHSRAEIDTGRPGYPTANASGDSTSRKPTSPTFSVQSGSTRSNKSSDPIGLCSSSSASRVSSVPRCFYVPHVTPASWLPGSRCC